MCIPGCLEQGLTLRSAAAGVQNIDLVIEGTGVFLDRAGAGKHLQAGAKKVRAPYEKRSGSLRCRE